MLRWIKNRRTTAQKSTRESAKAKSPQARSFFYSRNHTLLKERRLRILVVDDDDDFHFIVSKSLSQDFDVDTASDGVEGLKKALYKKTDLILLDIRMPLMSGDELLRELRKRSEFDSVPILLITAGEDEEMRRQLLREGAQDYISKYASFDELHTRVLNLALLKLAWDEMEDRNEELPRSTAMTSLREGIHIALTSSATRREILETIDRNTEKLQSKPSGRPPLNRLFR